MTKTRTELIEIHRAELIEIHRALHGALDRLLACYIENTKKGLQETNLMEFLEWSYAQTQDPSCYKAPTVIDEAGDVDWEKLKKNV